MPSNNNKSKMMHIRGKPAVDLTKIKQTVSKLPKRVEVPDKKDKPKRHNSRTVEIDDKIADSNESFFKKRLRKIKKAARKTNYDERTRLLMYKGLLDLVLEMIPIAEMSYKTYRTERAAYALNVYLNQAREIANDMRAVQDFQEHANKIGDMIREHFAQVARNLVDETYSLKKGIRDDVNPKTRRHVDEKIDGMTRSHGRYMNETVKALAEKITAFLVEKPDNVKTGRAAHGAKRHSS